MNPIVFTDLDGSLLDFDRYSFEGARPSLDRLKRLDIPVVFKTSKTRREVDVLRRATGIDAPFIVENGAAVYVPPFYSAGFHGAALRHEAGLASLVLGMDYARIRAFLVGVRREIDLQGFGDLSVEAIADLTGLTPEQAAMAKDREFSEPFLLGSEDTLPLLQSLATAKGMKIVTGGRFHHLIGAGQDKGEAVKLVRAALERQEGTKRLAIGLGDSDNDLPMLMAVDVPVLIPHPERGLLPVDLPRMVCATQPGSRGWNEVMERLLDGYTTEYP